MAGRTIGIGFRFITIPTARAARGFPRAGRQLGIRLGAAVGHLRELVEDGDDEPSLTSEVELEVERRAPAGEVVVELATGLVE